MHQPLSKADFSTAEVIVYYPTALQLGDRREWNAIRPVFGENIPSLASKEGSWGTTRVLPVS
jgi:hypothetical protein